MYIWVRIPTAKLLTFEEPVHRLKRDSQQGIETLPALKVRVLVGSSVRSSRVHKACMTGCDRWEDYDIVSFARIFVLVADFSRT